MKQKYLYNGNKRYSSISAIAQVDFQYWFFEFKYHPKVKSNSPKDLYDQFVRWRFLFLVAANSSGQPLVSPTGDLGTATLTEKQNYSECSAKTVTKCCRLWSTSAKLKWSIQGASYSINLDTFSRYRGNDCLAFVIRYNMCLSQDHAIARLWDFRDIGAGKRNCKSVNFSQKKYS